MSNDIAALVDRAGSGLPAVLDALPCAVAVWGARDGAPLANRRLRDRLGPHDPLTLRPEGASAATPLPWGRAGPREAEARLPDGSAVAIHRVSTPEGATVVACTDLAHPARAEAAHPGPVLTGPVVPGPAAPCREGDTAGHLVSIIENISDGVLLIDRDHKLIEFNRRVLSIYGVDPGRVRRGMAYEAFVPLCRDLRELGEARRAGEIDRRRDFALDPARRFTIRQLFTGETLEITKEVTADGASVITVRDITESLRQARALEEERRREHEASRHKSRFMARMSHEMRTPLNGVLGISALLERSDLDAQQATLVAAIRDSGTVLLRLIDDLLDSTRLDTMDFELVNRPFLVCDVVREAVQIIAPEARARGLALEKAPAAIKLPSVVGDAVRLKQVLLNLFSNALKFTDAGTVTVGLSAEVAGETAVMSLYVEDTGIGIAPEDQQRIFNQFEQLDPERARPAGGVGLGLSISRRIVEAMGGTLGVVSTPGKGSRFTVDLTLPLTPEDQG